MSDDKYIKDKDTIAENDMIPNPPQVNGKLKYYLLVIAVILAVISAMAVVLGSNSEKSETKTASCAKVQYII